MLIQLHNSDQSHQSNYSYNSPNPCPCLRPLHIIRWNFGCCTWIVLKILNRLLRKDPVPDPANVADQRNCGDQVQPEIKSEKVAINGERAEEELNDEESKGSGGDSVEDFIGWDRAAEDSNVVHEEGVEGDHGHEEHVAFVVQDAVHHLHAAGTVPADGFSFIFGWLFDLDLFNFLVIWIRWAYGRVTIVFRFFKVHERSLWIGISGWTCPLDRLESLLYFESLLVFLVLMFWSVCWNLFQVWWIVASLT